MARSASIAAAVAAASDQVGGDPLREPHHLLRRLVAIWTVRGVSHIDRRFARTQPPERLQDAPAAHATIEEPDHSPVIQTKVWSELSGKFLYFGVVPGVEGDLAAIIHDYAKNALLVPETAIHLLDIREARLLA